MVKTSVFIIYFYKKTFLGATKFVGAQKI